MPSLRVVAPAALLDLDTVRRELEAPGEFSAEALAEAERSAAAPRLPELDRTELPMVTIDPPGSRDLDQALHLERTDSGFRVSYAIADVAAFVTPGGALDGELTARGVTLYAPDKRIPLHPPVLGEAAASLLPDQVRPALLWQLDLDATGELIGTDVRRALVRSRQRLDYMGVQAALDAGTAEPMLMLLSEIGQLRQARARERGAVDLPTPEQEVVLDVDGRPRLELRAQLPCEAWNAQLSLLTGIAAAALMLRLGVGLLRTLPPADPESVQALRRSALALGVAWPQGRSYGDVMSTLDPTLPTHAALLTLATRLLRGAGYTAFDGAPPEQPLHSGVAAAYAHCTAPLRRLSDRHVGEVCLAAAAGAPVPGWARQALPGLPEVMARTTRRAGALERAVVDAAEAVVLSSRVGERFDAVVVDSGRTGGVVQLADPAVRARCEDADLRLGQAVQVVLVRADPQARVVLFRLA
ncbi:MAG: RNB domain-containing ribonuclease [Frankiales bacterium]|nr:RNB domain-containing ribonuclease [Frankiales bacterium]